MMTSSSVCADACTVFLKPPATPPASQSSAARSPPQPARGRSSRIRFRRPSASPKSRTLSLSWFSCSTLTGYGGGWGGHIMFTEWGWLRRLPELYRLPQLARQLTDLSANHTRLSFARITLLAHLSVMSRTGSAKQQIEIADSGAPPDPAASDAGGALGPPGPQPPPAEPFAPDEPRGCARTEPSLRRRSPSSILRRGCPGRPGQNL